MSVEDFRRIVRNRIRLMPSTTTLDPAAVDKPGSVLNIVAAAMATIGAELDARASARIAARLKGSSTGADLDQLVSEETAGELPRLGAATAVMTLKASRPTSGAGGGTIPAGTAVLVGGLTFTLNDPIVFAPTALGPLVGNFTCSTAGPEGNLGPSDVKGFANPGALFDPSLVLAAYSTGSDGYAAGGSLRESDAEYRARSALYESGTDVDADLLVAGALSTPGVKYASLVEHVDGSGVLTGDATLYIADVNGRANKALVARVVAGLRDFRMPGQQVYIVGAAPVLQAIVVHYAVLSGFDQTAVFEKVRAAVVASVNKLPPGATLTIASLTAAVFSVAGTVADPAVPDGIVSPSVDTAPPAPSTLFRTSLDLVTFG